MIGPALSVNPLLYLMIPAAFLVGSIPFGILFTRGKGIDIRTVGSKNIGATNVLRTAGKMPAVLTLLCDILKGAAAVVICRVALIEIVQPYHAADAFLLIEDLWLGIAGLAAVMGHMFSVFLDFRGGKGVATGFGVMAVYSPAVGGTMLLIWLACAMIFKYSSLSALIAFISMPVLLFLFDASGIKIMLCSLLTFLIIYKHMSNIRNLIAGTESRIGKKSQ